MKELNNLKIALVHDFLTEYGGAERVLEVLVEMFPQAPIYTLLYDREKMRGAFKGKIIYTSFLQKLPRWLRRRRQLLLPFLPTAPETFNLREFDLVISSSGAWSKGIVTKLNTKHVAYVHSPMRFAWDYNEKYLVDNRREKIGFFVRPLLSYVRLWDREAADRPDFLIANSKYTHSRIQKYYRRESAVIYPPINNDRLNQEVVDEKRENNKMAQQYFLVVSRLSPYKKVELVVEAFNKLELPLVVIGEGKERHRLEKLAGKTIQVLGWKSDREVQNYYQNARALIFPTLDDFGLTMVEAMSQGTPVIAFRKGGALEIIEEGVTGEFFNAQTPEVLADGVRRFMEKESQYNREKIKECARQFSKERFKREMLDFLKSILT
ncbi:glycosyltransferase family 4 protein [Patescibacteria group bacterium]|nr:MAG: glycosyltransferase family 4 protein [Patescibacteria group bacterium]